MTSTTTNLTGVKTVAGKKISPTMLVDHRTGEELGDASALSAFHQTRCSHRYARIATHAHQRADNHLFTAIGDGLAGSVMLIGGAASVGALSTQRGRDTAVQIIAPTDASVGYDTALGVAWGATALVFGLGVLFQGLKQKGRRLSNVFRDRAERASHNVQALLLTQKEFPRFKRPQGMGARQWSLDLDGNGK